MVALYMLAALAEIAGCFAFWAWARQDQSVLWLVPGIALLAFFAFVLTQVESTFAGRAYAAYGGVYIAGSLLWLLIVERIVPDRWDMIGGTISLIGALVIIFGPRGFASS
ncbi:MAG: YnfA family protein [Rhodobiaceae bacterium]|nr:YnfA family protein [Rhodobiaceae bacterium]